MKFQISCLLFLFYTIVFSQNFTVSTNYSGCNTTGEIIIIPNDTTKVYRYRMDSNRCNLTNRQIQNSNIFTNLPPCYYEFTAIDEQGVEYYNIRAKLGLKLTTIASLHCDTGTSHLRTFYAYNIIDHNLGLFGGKNRPYNFPLQFKVSLNDRWIDSLSISADDSIFTVPTKYYGAADSVYRFEITDACSDMDIIFSPFIQFIPTIKASQDCNSIYYFVTNNFLFDDVFERPIQSVNYKWFMDSALIGTGYKISFDTIPKNKKLTAQIDWDGCSVNIANDFSSIPIDSGKRKNKIGLRSGAHILCKNQKTSLFIIKDSTISKITWSNGIKDIDTILVDKEGIYTVYVENINGCKDSASISIKTSALKPDTFVVQNKCFGSNTASIDLSPTGGISPYSFSWNDNSTSEDRIDLFNGSYKVIVSDSIGCKDSVSFTIKSPPPLGIELTAKAATCAAARDGSFTASAVGGSPPYRINWNTGYDFWMVDTLSVGRYKITVSDQNQCNESFEFRIDDLSPLRSGKIDTICAGSFITVNNKKYTASGRYVDTLTSRKGCDSIHVTTLVVNKPLDFTLISQDPTCHNSADGQVSVILANLTPISYFINNAPVANGTIPNLTSGNYIIKIQDRFNCFKEKGIALSNPEKIQFSLGMDTILQFGDSIFVNPILNLNPSQIKSIKWSSSPQMVNCNNCINGVKYRPTQDHVLNAILENNTGCKVEAKKNVKLNLDFKAFVPNIFKPDGISTAENQRITVMGGSQVRQVLLFRIFNRFGALVHQYQNFSPNDLQAGWDGFFKSQGAPQGVYVYFAELEYIDGTRGMIKGDFTLLR